MTFTRKNMYLDENPSYHHDRLPLPFTNIDRYKAKEDEVE